MAICVDRLRVSPWRYGNSCHLFNDAPELDGSNYDLHAFAKSIGLDERSFQLHAKMPHYDLSAGMRIAAVVKGAKEVKDSAIKRLLRIKVAQEKG